MKKFLFSALAILLAMGVFSSRQTQTALASQITPPPVPDNRLQVPEGNKLFLVGHATGTQNYVCRPSGAGVAYVLFTPQATLFG